MNLKKIITTTIVSAIIFQSFPVYAEDNSDIIVKLNGREINFLDQKAKIINERTLIPLRGIFDEMGFIIEWNNEARIAKIKNSYYEITIGENMNRMYVNGEEIPIDVPAQIVNNRMMIPLRAVAESINANINWSASTRTALIEYRPVQNADESIQRMHITEQEYIDNLIFIKSKLKAEAESIKDALLSRIFNLGTYDEDLATPINKEQYDNIEIILSELGAIEVPDDENLKMVDRCVKDYVELVNNVIIYSKNHNPKNTYDLSNAGFSSDVEGFRQQLEKLNSDFGNHIISYFINNEIYYEGIYGEAIIDMLLN